MSPANPARSAGSGLHPADLLQIPHFLLLREIQLYMIVYRDFDDPDNISPDNIGDKWLAAFMNGRRARIEQGTPYLNTIDLDGLIT